MSKYQFQQANKNVASDTVVRTTGRIKKPKAVFDPSDNYVPRLQRVPVALTAASSVSGANTKSVERHNSTSRTPTPSSDSSVVPKELCVACGKRESKRTSIALKNPMLCCLECKSKIHRYCLKFDFDDLEHVRQSYKCDNCTFCHICLKNNHVGDGDNKLIVCSKCSKGYHVLCLQKYSSGSPGLNWKCSGCDILLESTNKDDPPVKKVKEVKGGHAGTDFSQQNNECNESPPESIVQPSVNVASVKDQDISESEAEVGIQSDESASGQMSKTVDNFVVEQKLTLTNNITDQTVYEIPDVKNWSVNQVYEYVRIYFPKEAAVFKDQEIDGSSLLLLKRSDVINKLHLKLGPSLRIYAFILKLQTQKNDPTLGWNCDL